MMIVCAGNNEQFDFAIPVGVGLTQSAISLTRYCIEQKPKTLIFVGTAGSYGEHKPFDIIESAVAVNIENSSLEGKSYTPLDQKIDLIGLTSNDNVSRETVVNSSNYITTDEHFAKQMVEKGVGLENMEFFSILSVAREFRIPAFGVFAVTNYCDNNGHKDFVNHHEKAKQILTEYIRGRYV